jgi:hypothetical protein
MRARATIAMLVLAAAAGTGGAWLGAGGGGAITAAASPPAADTATWTWKPHVATAQEYAQQRRGSVRFAVIDIEGRIHKFDAAQTAPAASVFKVMLLVAYLRKVGDRPLHRWERRLLIPMIRRSDSVAATRVRDLVGRARIEKLARIADMHRFHYNQVWGLSRTNPRDQVWFMYRLEQYIPERHRHFARYQLAHIVPSQRWGIGQIPLNGWHLFFKGGWGSGSGRVDHQVAFLQKGSRRIAVAIFTEFDPSHTYGKRTLEGVARRLLRGLPD